MSVGRLFTRGLGTFGAAHYLLTRGLDSSAPVTVPNVVGETEAQAIIDIQAVGLVESSTTAYSDIVAIGLVISQDPASGSSVASGSTVAVVISLGPQPVTSQNSGGFYFEEHILRRRKRQQELLEAEKAEEELQDKIEREIAQLLHEQERKDEERRDLERVKSLVSQYGKLADVSERVSQALLEAQQKETAASYLKLQREFERMLEEEEHAVLMMLIED